MRKYIAIALMFVAVLACGQTIHYKTSATLQWDAVTLDSNGKPFLATDVVAYEVYIKDAAAQILVGTTSATQLLIAFPYRTTWVAGVRVKLTDSGGNVSYSAIAWSDIPEVCLNNSPFLYSPSGTPTRPKGLRDAGT